MPTFLVSTPTGRQFEVDGADENEAISSLQNYLSGEAAPQRRTRLTPEMIDAYQQSLGAPALNQSSISDEDLKSKLAEYEHKPGFLESLGSGAERSFSQAAVLKDQLLSLGAKGLGYDDYAKQKLDEAAAKQEEIQQTNPAQFESYKDVNWSNLPAYAGESIGEQAFNALTMLGFGGVGGAIGKRVVTSAAEKAVAEMAAQRAAAGAAEAAVPAVERLVAREAAKGAGVGGNIGMYLGSFGLNAGDTYQGIYDKTGEMAPGASVIGASINGFLDSIVPARFVKALRETPTLRAEVAARIAAGKGVAEGLLPAVKAGAMGALKGGALEPITEVGQEIVNKLAEDIVGESQEKWGSEDFDRFINSAAKSIAPGMLFGFGEGVGKQSNRRAIADRLEQQQQARQFDADQLASEEERKQQLYEGIPELEQQVQMLTEALNLPENRARAGELNFNLRETQQQLNDLSQELTILEMPRNQRAQFYAQQQQEEEIAPEEEEAPPTAPAPVTARSVLEPLGVSAEDIKGLNVNPNAPLRGNAAQRVADFIDQWRVNPNLSLEQAQAADAALAELPELQSDAISVGQREDREAHLAAAPDLVPKKMENWYKAAQQHGLTPESPDAWQQLSDARYAARSPSVRAALTEKLKADFPEQEQGEADRVAALTEQQRMAEEQARAEAVFKKAQDATYRKQVKDTIANFLAIAKEQQRKLEAARKQAAQEGKLKAEQDAQAGTLISELDRHLNSDLPALTQAQLDAPDSTAAAVALRQMRDTIAKKQEALNNLAPVGTRPTPRPATIAPPNITAMQTVSDVLRHAGFPGAAKPNGMQPNAPLRGATAEKLANFLQRIKPESVKDVAQGERIDALKEHPAFALEEIERTKAEDHQAHIESAAGLRRSREAFQAWQTQLRGDYKLGTDAEKDQAVYRDLRTAQGVAQDHTKNQIEKYIYSSPPLKKIAAEEQQSAGPLAEVRESRAESRSGAGAFSEDAFRKAMGDAVNWSGDYKTPGYKSKDKLIEMPIADFLTIADDGFQQKNYDDVLALFRKGIKFNAIPQLSLFRDKDGNIRGQGHEGRHRARVLRDNGYDTIPVKLLTDIRWSEQSDPKSFDYLKKWPSKIISQDGTKSIPMLVPREQSMTPWSPSTKIRESRAGKVTKNRTPELQAAAEKLKAGEITREDYARLVNKYKPVVPYEQVPAPASNADMEQALDKPKVPKINAPRGMANGTPVKLRLDIPAYDKHNTWIVTVHEGNKPGFKAEAVIGYTSTAAATDVTFGLETAQAGLNIAGGKPKGTIATMKGKWRDMTPEKAKARADAAMKDPAWRQIGMDPERHGYFYDRETMQPITRADEVIQIGPLVLGKNVTYGKPDNFLYSRAAEGSSTKPTPEQVRKVIEDRMGASAANVTIARTPKEAGVDNVKGIHPLTKGAIINGKAYLFTDNMRVGKEFGVFLHEVGDHLGMKKLVGEGNYNFLVSQVQKWADKNDGSLESKIARAAMERIPQGTKKESELLAYFIEEAVDNYGVNPSEVRDTATPLGAFFRKIMAGIKNILNKLGLSPKDLTSQDIIDLAYGAAQLELSGQVKGKGTSLSLSSDKNISPLGFYSALEYNLSRLPTKSATAAGWKDAIKGLLNKGLVKAEEVEWSGINDWLDLTEGKITREQVQDYLAQGGVQVEETVLGRAKKKDDKPLTWGEWSEPDENGHKEMKASSGSKIIYKPKNSNSGPGTPLRDDYVVIDSNGRHQGTVNDLEHAKQITSAFESSAGMGVTPTRYNRNNLVLPNGKNYREVLLTLPSKKVKGRNYGHWEQSNVLAHTRLNDRVDTDGKRVLFVEEVQSDWGQKGKKEGFVVSLPPLKELPNDVVVTKKYNATIDEVEYIKAEFTRINRIITNLFDAADFNPEKRKKYNAIVDGEKGDRFLDLSHKFTDFNSYNRIDRVLNTVPHSEFLEWRELIREIVPTAFETDPYESRQIWVAIQSNARIGTGETKEEAKKEALDVINENRKFPDGIASAPFVTKTEGWVNLALKRIMIMAAEEGYDSVAFSNGKQNADRYNLANHVESIQVLKEGEGYYVTPTDKDGYEFPPQEAKNAAELERMVGVELAKKIVKDFSGKPNDSFTAMQNEDFETYAVYNQNLEQIGPKFDDYDQAADYAKDLLAGRVVPPRVYSGLDLDIGGEGMKTFYDQIIPSALKKLLPKVDGGKLRNVNIDFSGDASNNEELPWNIAAVRRIIQSGGEVYAVTHYGSEEQIRSEQDLEDILEYGEPRGFIYGDKGETLPQLGFDITPEMVSKIEGGLPQFSRAPEVRESRAPGVVVNPRAPSPSVIGNGTAQGRQQLADYAYGRMDTVMRNTPQWGKATMGKALGELSNMPTSARKFVYYAAQLPQLADMIDKTSPSAAARIRDLGEVLAARKTRADKRKAFIEKILLDGKAAVEKYTPAQLAKFEEVTHNLSREQIDPWDAANKTHPLSRQFYALPKPLQDIFSSVVAAYRQFGDEYLDHMEKIAGPAFSPAMKMQYKMRMKRIMPYLPLFREGDFWVAYTDRTGEAVVRACDTDLERSQVMRAAQAAGATDIQPFKQLADINPNNVKPTREFAQIFNLMKEKGVDEAVQAKVYQTLLQMFPAKSIMQQFRPRKGTLGYREDILRNFAIVGSRMADNLTQFEFTKDIDNVYSDLGKELLKSERSGDDVAVDMLNELKQRENFLRYPVNSKYANLAASASYNQFLLGNISSSVMNSTSLVMSTLPVLGGEYGYGRTAAAMSRALSMYAKGGRDDNTSLTIFGRRLSDKTFMGDSARGKALEKSRPDLKKLYDTAISRQAIHRSVGLELHDMRKMALSEYTGSWMKIKTLLSWLFQNSERMNREITLLAAYQLEMDALAKRGIRGDAATNQAIDKAIKAITFTQGVATPELGSRALQGNIGKVIGTFKKYPMTQLYMVGTLFNDAIRGASAKEKQIAQKQLLGIMGMGWAFAGVKGLPLVGGISFLAEMIIGDDDEPFDIDQWALESMGNLGWNGLVSDMTGLRISDRAAIGSFFREDKKRLQELGWQWYLAEQTIGAPASLVKNWIDASELFQQGYTLKAAERALPLFMSNAIKAVDQGINGIVTKDGVRIADDPSTKDLIMQGIGFRKESTARAQDVNTIENQITTAVNARRTQVLNNLWRFRNDPERLAEAREARDDFNRSRYGQLPKNRITAETIEKSKKQHKVVDKAAAAHAGMAPDQRYKAAFRELEESVDR